MASQSDQGRAAGQQESCCRAYALENPEATFCIMCGKPLLRCMAFSECGGIVDEKGLCPVCVQPRLYLNERATITAPLGGSVAVPLELVNISQVDRPLFVKRLWSRERGDWRQERLGWERLNPGDRQSATVTACEIEKPGTHAIDIMWEVATQWKAREEHFAFSSTLILTVPAASAEQNITNIHITAENQQGNVNQITVPERRSTGVVEQVPRLDMQVERQDAYERRSGLRGMEGGAMVGRNVPIVLKGFAEDHLLGNERPIVTSDAALRFGRMTLRGTGGNIDVQLVAQGEDGAMDAGGTAYFSRQHFEIFIENERLMLRVLSENGARVDGTAYGLDKLVPLTDGSEIAPIVKATELLTIKVRFRYEGSNISMIELSREPAWREGAA